MIEEGLRQSHGRIGLLGGACLAAWGVGRRTLASRIGLCGERRSAKALGDLPQRVIHAGQNFYPDMRSLPDGVGPIEAVDVPQESVSCGPVWIGYGDLRRGKAGPLRIGRQTELRELPDEG